MCDAGHIFATQLQPPSQADAKKQQQGQGKQQQGGGGAYVPLNAVGTAPITPSEAAAAAVGAYRHAKRALQDLVEGGPPAQARLDASAVQRLQCHLQELECAALQQRLRLLTPGEVAAADELEACVSKRRALGCQAGTAAAGASAGAGQQQQEVASAAAAEADSRDEL